VELVSAAAAAAGPELQGQAAEQPLAARAALAFLQVLLGLQHFVAAAAAALVRTGVPARAVPVEMAAAVPVRLPLAAAAQAGLTGQPIQAAAAAAVHTTAVRQ
jgi:hypothetical protein